MSYTLLGANVSPYVRKVRALLAEKGIAYAYEPVNPFAPPPGWRDLSPLGKIPALKDGDKVINDSSCICQYLERKQPAVPMLPRDDDGFVHAIWIEEFVDGGMGPVAGGKVFFPLVVQPRVTKQAPDEATLAAVAKTVAEELPRLWDYLEAQLDGRDVFAGQAFGLADIAVASMHVNLLHAKVTVDSTRWPKLAQHLARAFARPSFKALIEEEAPTWTLRAG
jgi:glutathione S-transferase